MLTGVSINIFDAVVIGIMLMSCMLACFRGIVREILSLSAWIGAGLVTIYYFPQMTEKLQPHFKSQTVAAGFATLGLYIAALICFSMLNMIILKFVKSGSDVGFVDNFFGFLFGIFRGAFILSLGFFIITVVLPNEEEYPLWLEKSLTRPYLEKGAVALLEVAPDYLKDISSLQKKALKAVQKPSDGTYYDPDAATESGYSDDANKGIDRLIDSNE